MFSGPKMLLFFLLAVVSAQGQFCTPTQPTLLKPFPKSITLDASILAQVREKGKVFFCCFFLFSRSPLLPPPFLVAGRFLLFSCCCCVCFFFLLPLGQRNHLWAVHEAE
jgi:hypothetical protein